MNKSGKSLRYIIFGALTAAIYTVLTLLLMPISYGLMQIRAAEALCVLPALMPAAIPGLAIGCLLTNIIGGFGIADIVFGTLATLIAAAATYLLRKYIWLVPLPPVISNAFIVGPVLHFAGLGPLWACMLGVGVGELIACYVIGLPLYAVVKKLLPGN